MRILGNYQNNCYYNKNYVTTSFKSAKAAVGSLEELSEEVRAILLKAAEKQGVELPVITKKLSIVKTKTARKLVLGIQANINAAQKQLDELCKMLEGAGIVIETKSKPAKSASEDIDPKVLLERTLHNKTPRCKTFNTILDSKGCTPEQAQEILENITPQIIKEPAHRVELIEKILVVAERTKDKNLLRGLKYKDFNEKLDYWRQPNKRRCIIDNEKIAQLNKKIFDIAIKINCEDIIKEMYNKEFSKRGCDYTDEFIRMNKKHNAFCRNCKGSTFCFRGN